MLEITNIPGSIQAYANNQLSISEALLNVVAVVLFDVSISMNEKDAPDGTTRYDYALKELAHVQNTLPGRVAIVSFSSSVMFHPNGIPTLPMGSTDMALGLEFIKAADGIPDIKLILISDGEPDSEYQALVVAQTFDSPLDTIYIGPENGPGKAFLEHLSRITGGESRTSVTGKYLADNLLRLLAVNNETN